ncbi:hypothetical protein [Streptomyces spongiae]|uniref:Uncharacterized protein n=1 Tax=Streptomyces spongiae TaxID=565072 RepID=A0A5N8XNU2_9ACTN|nr:hypothetical protein [Streptomyces spongiae]MPY60225.1 hypothetical protein [Streptomyces spongiae]
MAVYMGDNPEEARATKILAACTLIPVLCGAFQDLGSKFGGMYWLTTGYFVWPFMIAPVAFLVLFIKHRELIRNPQKGAHFAQTIKMASGLFLFLNVIAIAYSWLAVISVLSALTILVASRRLKKQASA